MKVLVIGGSGFIGSHVADALSERNYDVTVFDINDSEYLKAGQEFIQGSVLDEDLLNDVISNHSIVYNFAAVADINEAIAYPRDAIKINALGTLNILDACRKQRINRHIYASSMYVYNNYSSFYGTSKKISELLINNYHREYGLPYTTIRYGSLYGPRCQEWNGLYRVVKEAVSEGKIEFDGWRDEIREYIHVKDAADLSVRVLNEKYRNKTVILTGTTKYKWGDLIDIINESVGGGLEISYQKPSKRMHYKKTPYIYQPEEATKLIKSEYYDVKEGIYNLVKRIHENQ